MVKEKQAYICISMLKHWRPPYGLRDFQSCKSSVSKTIGKLKNTSQIKFQSYFYQFIVALQEQFDWTTLRLQMTCGQFPMTK